MADSHRSTLAFLLLLAATCGCNSPKTAPVTKSEPSLTRTEAIQTRENPRPEAPVRTPPPQKAAEAASGVQPPSPCSLSFASQQVLVDCSFAPCPRAFLAQMATAESLALVKDSTAFKVLPSRSTPPRSPFAPLLLEPAGAERWILTGTALGTAKAECSVAGTPGWDSATDGTIRMASLSVRTGLEDSDSGR